MSTTTRNGKIARLPKAIRDRLNQQILDGVPGKDLVRWLNDMTEVVDILVQHFNATRVTEQNLSEWKQGGYQDWLKHQERRDWVRRLTEEAEDVAVDAGVMPWMERVGALFEVVLGKVVEQRLQNPIETPEQMNELVTLSRELARHRQLSQEAAKQRRKELRRQERENPIDMDERIERARGRAWCQKMKEFGWAHLFHSFTASMTPEAKEALQKQFDEKTLKYLMGPESPGFANPVEDDPEDEEADSAGKGSRPASPTKSDSIRPDPTSFSEAA